jgi:two-component system LytT family sensor kinase
MHHVMSDISLPANGAIAGERPSVADERPADLIPVRRNDRFFGRMAAAVIVIFWIAQFATVTVSRLVPMPDSTVIVSELIPIRAESWANIQPRAVVTLCAILLSFGILAVLRGARRWTLLRRALIAAGLAAAGCCIHTAINMVAFMLFSRMEWGFRLNEYIISYSVLLFWFYSALSVMLLALTYGEDLVEREERIASLQAKANVAQLNALRYQLNPHFLFNALNSVASLICKKMGAEAEAMVVGLSDFLRTTLRMDSGREITLEDEIKLQSLYLDIEKIRFPQRLSVTIDVPGELRDARVPNLITQPLIENAIKHGVRRSSSPVHLEVIARDWGGRLSLEIRDDGGNAGNGAAPAGTRIGLRNVAERLRLRFGDQGSFTAAARPGGGYSARILIPLRRA